MATTTQNQASLFTPKEMSQIANPAAKSVLQALADDKWDFRTVEGISKETGLPSDQVNRILQAFPEFVRRSPVRDRLGRSIYTLKSRKMKGQEKKALLRLFLTKST
jgi:hypothetical protein